MAAGRRNARLTVRQVISAFLAAKRTERGRQTADDYRARLRPVLAFAEQPTALARWPRAADLDPAFVAELKAFLMTCRTSRNGRRAAPQRLLSGTQVRHALETLRGALTWAGDPMVALLPPTMLNPVGRHALPAKPAKDPLRDGVLPLDLRTRLVQRMDAWQLTHLAWSFVLPLRPDEAAGLLVGDANAEKGWLQFGYSFADCNFTKEKTRFVLPYPPEFTRLLFACRGGRAAGPLLRSRRAFGGLPPGTPASAEEVRRAYEQAVMDAGPHAVQAEHDRKRVFRRLLRRWGGVSEDRLAAEFKALLRQETGRTDARFYDLRHATTQGLKDAGLPHLELRYLTGHLCRDILNEYTSVRPAEAMSRYFDAVRPLLTGIADRATELGLREPSAG